MRENNQSALLKQSINREFLLAISYSHLIEKPLQGTRSDLTLSYFYYHSGAGDLIDIAIM